MLSHILNDARQSLSNYYSQATSKASGFVVEASVSEQTQSLLNQIETQLHVLYSTAQHALGNRGSSALTPHAHYQTGARQLEAAMHRLRQIGWGRSVAATELSQCLTVIVLLSDLLANEQVPQGDASDSYDLLKRNISRANGCIAKIRG